MRLNAKCGGVAVLLSLVAAGALLLVSLPVSGQGALSPEPGVVFAWGFPYGVPIGPPSVYPGSYRGTTPIEITSLDDTKAISAGDFHDLAQKADGTVFTWTNSALTPGGDSSPTATPVPGLGSEVTKIESGFDHHLALKADGSVVAWGRNDVGQLGDGSMIAGAGRSVPAPVVGLDSGVTDISAGRDFSLAVKSGSVYAWGLAGSHLGRGTLGGSHQLTPVQVMTASAQDPSVLEPLVDVSAVAAGFEHSLAVKGGRVFAWGRNYTGQLGNRKSTLDGDPGDPVAKPVITDIAGFSDVAAGGGGGGFTGTGGHSLALRADGTVWSWGRNDFGQLGQGTVAEPVVTCSCVPVPAPVAGLAGVKSIDVGEAHSVALTGTGSVLTWGRNIGGELGDGSPVYFRTIPGPVPGLTTGVGAISAAYEHTLAISIPQPSDAPGDAPKKDPSRDDTGGGVKGQDPKGDQAGPPREEHLTSPADAGQPRELPLGPAAGQQPPPPPPAQIHAPAQLPAQPQAPSSPQIQVEPMSQVQAQSVAQVQTSVHSQGVAQFQPVAILQRQEEIQAQVERVQGGQSAPDAYLAVARTTAPHASISVFALAILGGLGALHLSRPADRAHGHVARIRNQSRGTRAQSKPTRHRRR